MSRSLFFYFEFLEVSRFFFCSGILQKPQIAFDKGQGVFLESIFSRRSLADYAAIKDYDIVSPFSTTFCGGT